ncbi:phage baseplate assembly protein V [Brevibacillus nitrificans]|uniref:phage baseplate assembly protein V n=1 Tax=Brevibacillus nitrificans TaxID=651560 RepID=UPI00285DF486|nr:phage baseplate assembly protein V [Brevibacillus nitrificans]MDR7318921.1 phage baseplate assembly protein V [Brevibacillus nitrificans]
MSVLKNLIRVGVVSAVNEQEGTVRVVFEDRDDMVSGDLPVIHAHTLRMKDYRIPDIKEQVVCIFQGNGIQEGYCLGAIYSETDLPPVREKKFRGTWFEDGSYVYFDREKGKLHVKAVGRVQIDGDLIVTGQIYQVDPGEES